MDKDLNTLGNEIDCYGLNPLKQVKSFGRVIGGHNSPNKTWGLNPLKQVKSFGHESNHLYPPWE